MTDATDPLASFSRHSVALDGAEWPSVEHYFHGMKFQAPELRELLETVLPSNHSIEDFEIQGEFPKIGRRIFALNARRVEQAVGLPGLILLAFEDLTNS